MSRDELVESAALVRGVRGGRLERIRIPDAPLDILAQQLVAEASAGPIHLDRLFALSRRAWPYRDLSREAFDGVVEMLSEGIATAPGRTTALLHRDAVNGRVKGRRGARLAALTGGSAIRTPRSTRSWPSPRARRSARWTRTSRWRASRATCSCSGTPPGGSGASKRDRPRGGRAGRAARDPVLGGGGAGPEPRAV